MCSYGINRRHDLFIFSRKEKLELDANSLKVIDEDMKAYSEEMYN